MLSGLVSSFRQRPRKLSATLTSSIHPSILRPSILLSIHLGYWFWFSEDRLPIHFDSPLESCVDIQRKTGARALSRVLAATADH